MDALQADAAAAQPREQHRAASISAHEAALKQLKKACKAAKGEHLAPFCIFKSPELHPPFTINPDMPAA